METLDICVTSHSLNNGNGIDISVMQFAEELLKRHNITLAFEHSDMNLASFNTIKFNRLGTRDLRPAAKTIKKHKFDLISSHYTPLDVVASWSGIPHYLHDPGIPPFKDMKGAHYKAFWMIVNSMRLVSCRNARCVLPISRYLDQEFRRKYLYRGRSEILPYGIDFPAEVSGDSVPFDKYVLYVGRHNNYKGVHKLIQIFSEVQKEVGDDVHLVTIGNSEPEYKMYLDALAKKVNNVHMMGFVPDVWAYFKSASVYATCSSWEGQDRPVIEAQYMGVPAVTFNNCSHPEVVLYGNLANNPDEFKNALIDRLNSQRNDSGVKSKIVEKFSPSGMVKRFEEIVKADLNCSNW